MKVWLLEDVEGGCLKISKKKKKLIKYVEDLDLYETEYDWTQSDNPDIIYALCKVTAEIDYALVRYELL